MASYALFPANCVRALISIMLVIRLVIQLVIWLVIRLPAYSSPGYLRSLYRKVFGFVALFYLLKLAMIK